MSKIKEMDLATAKHIRQVLDKELPKFLNEYGLSFELGNASYDDDIHVKQLIIMILSNHTRVTTNSACASINCFGQTLSGSCIHLQLNLLLL